MSPRRPTGPRTARLHYEFAHGCEFAHGQVGQTDRGAARAFTLTELLVVMAIVGILAVIAVPRLATALAGYRADAAAKRIKADLSLAQHQARLTSAIQEVEFDVGNDTYLLKDMRHLDHSWKEYALDLSEEPYRAAILSADFGGRSDVAFDGYGVPDSGGTIVVQSGGQQRTITVDPDTGRASVQ